jgi:hypothetical protein
MLEVDVLYRAAPDSRGALAFTRSVDREPRTAKQRGT